MEVWKSRHQLAMVKKQELFNNKMAIKEHFASKHEIYKEAARLRALDYYKTLKEYMIIYMYRVILPHTLIMKAIHKLYRKKLKERLKKVRMIFNVTRLQRFFRKYIQRRNEECEGLIKDFGSYSAIWMRLGLQLRCQTLQINYYINAKNEIGNFFNEFKQPRQLKTLCTKFVGRMKNFKNRLKDHMEIKKNSLIKLRDRW